MSNSNNTNCTPCYGCYGCYGCDGCYGCYYSFGLSNCKATYKALFSKDLFGDKYKLFNKDISESRFDEVMNKIQSFSFYPKQTNAFELYVQNGNDWSKIDTSKLSRKDWNDSWEDCPKDLVSYISSLPEFDAKLFKDITGLEIPDNSSARKKAKALEDKAKELLDQAEELRKSL